MNPLEDDYTCIICRSILKMPLMCEDCQILFCNNCISKWQIQSNQCPHCKRHSIFKKAPEIILKNLELKNFNCDSCGKQNIPYKIYINHYEICGELAKYKKEEELDKLLKFEEEELEEIKQKEKEIKETPRRQADDKRKNYIQFNLSSEDKSKILRIFTQGKPLEKLREEKERIGRESRRKFNHFEEITKKGTYWTLLHLSGHYGRYDIFEDILKEHQLEGKEKISEIIDLRTSDNKCPLRCLLESELIKKIEKRKFLDSVFSKFNFEVSKELELSLRNFGYDYKK